jgi:hypothetical protein
MDFVCLLFLFEPRHIGNSSNRVSGVFMSKRLFITAAMVAMFTTSAAFARDTKVEATPAGQWTKFDAETPRVALQSKATSKSNIAAVSQPQPAGLQQPGPEAMLIMIRSSMLALSQANQTNNYAVLNALGSDNFRNTNSPARLGELFAAFRTSNIDLAPVALINPQLSVQPQMTDGRLRLVGFFPSQPMQVNFDLSYEPTAAGWKLFGIAVNLNRAAQAAEPVAR